MISLIGSLRSKRMSRDLEVLCTVRLKFAKALNVTGGYSPTRRGEQPAPTLPRQGRSTR